MRRALAIDEQSYGPDHPDVARVLNNLAALLRATKRLAEAQPLMRRAQPTRSEALTLMAEAYRHHRATPQVIIVPVPCGGSPEPVRNVKPGKYPHDKREPWRPQRAIPNKAERLRRFLDQVERSDQAAREIMKPNAALLSAWVNHRTIPA